MCSGRSAQQATINKTVQLESRSPLNTAVSILQRVCECRENYLVTAANNSAVIIVEEQKRSAGSGGCSFFFFQLSPVGRKADGMHPLIDVE